MEKEIQPKVIVHGKASRNSKGEEVDIGTMIDRSGCGEAYYKLEDCLADNERDWRKCQNFVKAWKNCFDNKHRIEKEVR